MYLDWIHGWHFASWWMPACGKRHQSYNAQTTIAKSLRNGIGIWTCWWSDWAFILWCPSRWEDMSSFFSSSIRKWFWMAEPICRSRCDCRGPRCKANELDRLLHANFGSNPHLSSALTSILIPFFDIRIQQLEAAGTDQYYVSGCLHARLGFVLWLCKLLWK